jgi:hypothetical protein
MNTRNLATTAAVMVTMAACSMATVTAWLLVSSPTTVALAVKGNNVQPIAELALHALYTVVASLVRYL